MEQLEPLLLELYEAVSELPCAEYMGYAMGLLRPHLGFDSARTATLDWVDGGMVVHDAQLYREPPHMMLDWTTIAGKDLVMRDAMEHLGTAIAFHANTRYAGEDYSIMRDYAQRYEHRNGLVQMVRDPRSGHLDGVSLYRAQDHAHFSEAERRLAQRAAPHLLQALRLNRLLMDEKPVPPDLAQLAPRELEVARLYGAGRTYKEIARQLDMAPATVRNTLQHVFQKLGIGSKFELMRIFAMAGA